MQLQTVLTWMLISIVLLIMVQGTEAYSSEDEYLSSLKDLESEFEDGLFM